MGAEQEIEPAYGWGVICRGHLWADIYSTKTQIVRKYEQEWQMPWRKIKREYRFRIVRVKLVALNY